MSNSSTESRKFLIWVFLLTLVVFLRPLLKDYGQESFLVADDGWMATLTVSLVEDADFDLKNQLNQDPSLAQGQIALGKNGEWFSIHNPLVSVVAIPFYLLLGVNGFLVMNYLLSSLGVLFTFCLGRRVASREAALLATCLLTFSSVFGSYVYHFSIDVFGVTLLLSATLALFSGRYSFAGFLWGASVLGRLANGITFPAVIAFFVFRYFASKNKGMTGFSRFLLGGIPLFLLWAWGNYSMYGGAFETSYSRWGVLEGEGLVMMSQADLFRVPFFEGLYTLLFLPNSGVILSAPIVILAFLFGVRGLCSHAPAEAAFFIGVWVLLLGFYSNLAHSTYSLDGNRFFMSAILLSVLPLSLAFEDAFRGAREKKP